MVRHRSSRKSSNCLYVLVRGIFRTDLGSCFLDLPARTLPAPCPWKGSGTCYFVKLDLQFRAGIFRAAVVGEYSMEDLFEYISPRSIKLTLTHFQRKAKNLLTTSQVFGVFCFAMTIHVFLAFPETAGKPLEEVDEIFEKKVPAWRTHVHTKRAMAAERGEVEVKPTRLAESESPLERKPEVQHAETEV